MSPRFAATLIDITPPLIRRQAIDSAFIDVTRHISSAFSRFQMPLRVALMAES